MSAMITSNDYLNLFGTTKNNNLIPTLGLRVREVLDISQQLHL